MTIINDMIKESSGRKLEILKELKKLNKEGYMFMMQRYKTFKIKYPELQKTAIWKQAKKLLLEYFTLDRNRFRCDICGKFEHDHVMHHVNYDKYEIFTPKNVSFIHHKCHSKTHLKY